MSDKSLKKAASKSQGGPTAGGSSAPRVGQPRGNAAAQEMLKARREASDTPYTDTYGRGNNGPAFQVDAGQLTFDAEGTEGGRFHSRKAHVPPGPSGVTIGRGYDLGQHTKAQIRAALVGVGLSKGAADAYAKSAGLKGDEARAWLRRHESSLAEISPSQQEALFSTTYTEMSKDVQRISDKQGVVAEYGHADLDEMNPAIKDTLVDLRYRGDYTGKAREKVQKAAADNDLIDVTDTLSDRGQWKNVPEDRFQRRSKYLKETERRVEHDAYGTGWGPLEEGINYPSLAELQEQAKAKRGDGGGPPEAPLAARKPTAAKAAPGKAAGKAAGAPAQGTPRASAGVSPDDEWSDSTLVDYADYLRLELKSIAKLDAEAAAEKATVTLKQVERFVGALRKPGLLDSYEVARQPLSDEGTGAWVPPELVPMTRALAEIAEGGGGDDWNSRLGAQQYRTQSDNLAAPEATCNVTSMSMVLERLGYSRADVVAAVDREVKGRWLKSQGKKADGDLSDVDLPKGRWGDEVLRYLDKQQGAGKAYQRLRGHDTSGKERGQMAGAFRNDAQMEDLVDFLLSMLGVDRTAITPAAAKLLGRIETTAGERPAVETIRKDGKNTWDVVRARVHATLEEGGSAMLSIFHKGAGQSGTHLVVAQQVTSGGMIIDDPYGSIRADYDRGKRGDAYAEPGKTRKTSNLRNVPAMVDHDKDGSEDDWKAGAAGDLAANERRGAANEQSDAVLSKAWNYVTLYRRGGAAAGGR